eukprot:COSAG05_NODE_8742_length_676_cov_0.483536_2_plen_94_part_01
MAAALALRGGFFLPAGEGPSPWEADVGRLRLPPLQIPYTKTRKLKNTDPMHCARVDFYRVSPYLPQLASDRSASLPEPAPPRGLERNAANPTQT